MRKLIAYASVAILGLSSVIAQEAIPHFRLGYGGGVAVGPTDPSATLDLLPATLPDATVGEPWSFDFDDHLLRNGDPGVISWSLNVDAPGQTLPSIIDSLSSDGILSGDAVTAGFHTFNVHVTGSLGGADTQAYNLLVVDDAADIDFAMIDVTDAVRSSAVTSSAVTPTGVEEPTSISATGGAVVSVAGGTFVGSSTIDAGQSFAVRMTAGDDYEETVSTTVTIGSVSRIWSVTTGLEPLGFSIADVTGAMPSEVVTSDEVEPAGVHGPVSLSVTNGATVSIDGGAFVTSGTIEPGESFVVRTTASATDNGVVTSTVTLGTVSHAWSVTTASELVVTLTNNRTNVDLSTLFGSDWSTTRSKRVIVPANFVIGATNASQAPAMKSGTGYAGRLTIENNGFIRGYGGRAGMTTVGQNGGDALVLEAPGIILVNNGYIQGGGGSAGRGGVGGQGGYYTETDRDPVSDGHFEAGAYRWAVNTSTNQTSILWNTDTTLGGISPTATSYYYNNYTYYRGDFVGTNGVRQEYKVYRTRRNSFTTTGGAGGVGGQGAGYNQIATLGQPGAASSAGVSGKAGNGGNGGTGGAYGQPGNTGAQGVAGENAEGVATVGGNGFAGGRAGYAIVGTPGSISGTGSTVGHTP